VTARLDAIRPGAIIGALLALLLGVREARAGDAAPVAVRFGEHPGFGRIVIDVEHGETLAVSRQGDMLVVQGAGNSLRPEGRPPRNVRAIQYGEGGVTIALAPGTSYRRLLVNHHLVIDILDPAPSVQAGAAKPEAAKPEAAKPAPKPAVAVAAPAPKKPAPPAPRQPSPAPSPSPVAAAAAAPPPPAAPAPPAPTPQALTADARTVPDAGPGHLLAIPFAAQVGAAAFRRGAEALVVFDERKPIDLDVVKNDPVFGRTVVQLLPGATVLHVILPARTELRLERRKDDWMVTAIGGDAVPGALRAISPDTLPDRVRLPAQRPGQVVSVPDSVTGAVLLVGTQRDAGEGVMVPRRTPDFEMLTTWQGVAVSALSDALELRPVPDGFEIGSGTAGTGLAVSPPDPNSATAADASRMTRVFDLPRLRTEALTRRMQGAVLVAAEAPAQSKAAARRNVAEAMLALGMAEEAQSVLALATTGDARAEDDPQARGLAALASLLAGRPEEAGGLDDPPLDGSDEIALWRAIRTAMRRENAADAAQTFANTMPLLADYPGELRARILPLVAETMVGGGQIEAAQALVARYKDDASLDLARAMLARAKGQTDDALARYDLLSNCRDRLIRLRAAGAAVELRLASNKIDAAKAAALLGKMLFAWRGDGREVDLRLRVVTLLAQSGQWRPALQLLRETEAEWPDRAAELHPRLLSLFAAALNPAVQASLKPFDVVALAGENADLMPDGPAGLAMAEAVSDQLIALDLPDQAVPLLEKMIASAPPGTARGTFGGRLAALRLEQGDAKAAIDVLIRSAADSLPPRLLESRGITFAAAVAAQGDFPSAREALLELDTEAADRELAELSEAAKLWPDAEAGWLRLARRTTPQSGPLTEDQAQLLLRLASCAAEANDDAALTQLRTDIVPRLPEGKVSDLINLIATQKIHGISDLATVSRDIALAKAAAL
jgi:hypothetical protein